MEEILQLLLEVVERVPWSSVDNKLAHLATVQKHLEAVKAAAPPAGPETPSETPSETPEGSAQ